MRRLPFGPETEDQGGPNAHADAAGMGSTVVVTRRPADRLGVPVVISGDLRGSTAFSAACFGHRCRPNGPKVMPSPSPEFRPLRPVVPARLRRRLGAATNCLRSVPPIALHASTLPPGPFSPESTFCTHIPVTITTTYPKTLAQHSSCPAP